MTTDDRRQKLIEQYKNKEYRHGSVAAHIANRIAFQIRALRDQREWNQERLAQEADMKQERISVLENPNYSSVNIETLKRLARAFDVALIVGFVPFSDLAKWELNLSSDSLEVPSFDQDNYFKGETPEPVIEPIKAEFVQLGDEDAAAITAGNFMGTTRNGMGGLPQQAEEGLTLRLLQGGAR